MCGKQGVVLQKILQEFCTNFIRHGIQVLQGKQEEQIDVTPLQAFIELLSTLLD
jgi:hypothetical protein